MIKLLIVDDEKGLCENIKEFFEPSGFSVLVATNGKDALSLVRKEKPKIGP